MTNMIWWELGIEDGGIDSKFSLEFKIVRWLVVHVYVVFEDGEWHCAPLVQIVN
jgi:hypothetical protein